ncbi:DUF3817 domain-containing protein [Kineococcus glutinatus]|uniref:DUF3817 domain-containing protein n=1 Tax=Kineococcus glutinatus TaxID=1070872 RepID=A0ABP9I6X8_9ACTN
MSSENSTRDARPAASPAPLGDPRKVAAALLRYRVAAWLTGIGLLVLTLVGMPQKYLDVMGGGDLVVRAMGPIHGTLYVLLLITTFDLGTRVRWSVSRMVLTALAGTVPFLSFYAERVNQRAVAGQLGRR